MFTRQRESMRTSWTSVMTIMASATDGWRRVEGPNALYDSCPRFGRGTNLTAKRSK